MYNFLIIFILIFPSISFSNADRGYEIAFEVDQRDKGFDNNISNLTMILKDKYGQTTKRNIRNRILEGKDDGDKSLVIFDSPGDVRGTSFLSHTKKQGSDDQWLFLPALKRVKRIASSNKAGPFMGSEFAYEDIGSQELEKYTYKYIKDDKLNNIDCFVVEFDPVDPKSGYSFQKVWIDKEHYRYMKIEFYDRKKSLLKTLNYENYNIHLEKFWRADKLVMKNLQTGKETELIFSDWKFKTKLSEKDFQKNALKKIK